MMTKEELKSILLKTNITKETHLSQVREILASAGLPREKCRVCDGASKMCIILKEADFVIKWSTCFNCDDGFNEAYDEVIIYQRAVKAGLEMFYKMMTDFHWNALSIDAVVSLGLDQHNQYNNHNNQ